jgi:PDZ domain-containing protein
VPDPLTRPAADPAGPFDLGPDPGERLPASPSARSSTLSLAVLATLLLVAALVFVPVPYAIGSPGPTQDTLGAQRGTPLIKVNGTPTYRSTGQLRMTTVGYGGGPGYPVTVPMVLRAWLSGSQVVSPVESVFPATSTQAEIDKENSAEMISSQENASVAALEELGYPVPARLVVAGTVTSTGAVGVVNKGDVVVALQGTPVTTYTELVKALSVIPPGQPVTLGIERAGVPQSVQVVTGSRKGGGSQLGVFIDPKFRLPVDVTIKIEDIGGPSAGTMFALGIIDKLTPADEANGVVIAGTGTMAVDGTVGPIGGIRLKLAGARRDGATWFLAPADNCAEVVGHVPAGLRVVKVATLHQARRAVTAIGAGTGGSLPTCRAS